MYSACQSSSEPTTTTSSYFYTIFPCSLLIYQRSLIPGSQNPSTNPMPCPRNITNIMDQYKLDLKKNVSYSYHLQTYIENGEISIILDSVYSVKPLLFMRLPTLESTSRRLVPMHSISRTARWCTSKIISKKL